jgi:peptidoglycan L-alanyl-D-glutamate endopeptidase CwlK
MHPAVRQEVEKAYLHINDYLLVKGVRLRFTHTYRSFKEQENLYSLGRTQPGRIITNANKGLSTHNYGLAFDIVFLRDKDGDGTFETVSWDTKADFDHDEIADWKEVTNYFKKLGWTWGGDWKSFPDYPHFEKTFGLTTKQLLSRYNSQKTFNENIDGKIYKWVSI